MRITVLSFLFFFLSCSIPSQLPPPAPSPSVKLTYHQMYIYDNSSDTIIKDYEMYKIALAQGIVNHSVQQDTFVPGPGSTFLESLLFTPDGKGTLESSCKRDYDSLFVWHHKTENRDHSDMLLDVTIYKNDSISFYSGNPDYGIVVYYNGKIYNDSLCLKLSWKYNHFPFTVNTDSIRTYKLHYRK